MATHLDEKSVEDSGTETAADDRRYLNRELSWLEFNARVLCLAEDDSIPLLDRAKFLAIFAENLDEFFQVRVAGLKDQLAAGLGATHDGDSPAEQLRAIRAEADGLVERSVRVFLKSVAPSLAANGIVFSDWEGLDDDDRAYLVQVFEEQIYP